MIDQLDGNLITGPGQAACTPGLPGTLPRIAQGSNTRDATAPHVEAGPGMSSSGAFVPMDLMQATARSEAIAAQEAWQGSWDGSHTEMPAVNGVVAMVDGVEAAGAAAEGAGGTSSAAEDAACQDLERSMRSTKRLRSVLDIDASLARLDGGLNDHASPQAKRGRLPKVALPPLCPTSSCS